MNFKAALITSLFLASPALAQDQEMELVETVEGFQISRVAASNVCFATFNGKSTKGIPSFYATYKLTNGDRWQVTGYSEQQDKAPKIDVLTIRFDEEPQTIIQVELSKGSYFLPFTSAKDLVDYDKKVETAKSVSFELLDTKDGLTIDLAGLRAARAAMETCLEGLK